LVGGGGPRELGLSLPLTPPLSRREREFLSQRGGLRRPSRRMSRPSAAVAADDARSRPRRDLLFEEAPALLGDLAGLLGDDDALVQFLDALV
jgi:hypothetical protein